MNQGQAITFLLEVLGKPLPHGEIQEGQAADVLGHYGVPSRRGKAQEGELEHLNAPVLLRKTTGEWLVLVRASMGRLEVEGGDGLQRISKSDLWRATEGEFVEPLAAPDWGKGFTAIALSMARRHPRLIGPLALVGLATSTFGILAAWMIARMMDAHQAGPVVVVGGIIILAALAALQAGLTYLRNTLGGALAQVAKYGMGSSLLHRILGQPYARIASKNTGQIGFAMASVTEFGGQLGGVYVGRVAEVVQCTVGLVVAFLVSPLVGASLLLMDIVLLLVHGPIARRRISLGKLEAEATTNQMNYLAEVLNGAVTVKTQGIEGMAADRWHQKASVEIGLNQRATVYGILASALASATLRMAMLTVLGVTTYLVISGRLGIGGMMLAVQLCMSHSVSAKSFAENLSTMLAVVQPKVERIRELAGKEDPRPVGRMEGEPVRPEKRGRIEVRNVTFRYPGTDRNILENFSITVEPGERFWLRTPSGSGKTTILRLLAGLYEPDAGEILIDGQPPAKASAGVLYLPQTIRLFTGSIKFNLQLLSGCDDLQRLMRYSEETGLDEFVRTLQMHYETGLQISGGNFSGGQRQLIAMTAALASERPVLLLDEAMANLDWQIRPRIASMKAFEGRTVVYASHDKFFV